MQIRSIMIVGAGQMGSGIALVSAKAGLQVVLHDVTPELLSTAIDTLALSLDRLVSKGMISEAEKKAILGRIRPTTSLEDVAGVDFAIEAVCEDIAVKSEIFSILCRKAKNSVILASNTSSLSITEIAAQTDRPDRVIGMHFMNPVPNMALVEVVQGLATSDETVSTVFSLAQDLGKQPVLVRDCPGFVTNRVLMPMINEAIFCVHEGVAEPEAIDQIMRLGMHHPMGPLALADLIGLDTCLAIMNVLHDDFADSKYRPCPLLRTMVKAGWLGKKSGRGFFRYNL